MPDNFTTVAPASTAPLALPVATKLLDDGFHGGATVIVDASGARAKTLAVDTAGAIPVQALGGVTEAAPATDTASSGLNGRLQRIAQRLTTLLAGGLPAALAAGGGLKVEGVASGVAVRVGPTATAVPLYDGVLNNMYTPQDSATTNLVFTPAPALLFNGTTWDRVRGDVANGLDVDVTRLPAEVGELTETAPASDTASSGLNGRLQRIAQRITSLIALLPTALGANGGLKVEGIAGGVAQPVTPGATEVHLGEVGGAMTIPSANFTRPADTTAYASGDLVANSVTAGSVTPLSWSVARIATGSFMVRRARFKSSSTNITNASYRLHLYATSPTVTNGDNGVWLSIFASYLGAIDVVVDKAFSDASAGSGAPLVGTEINHKLASGSTIYGLLEARAARTPANAEVFTVELEVLQN